MGSSRLRNVGVYLGVAKPEPGRSADFRPSRDGIIATAGGGGALGILSGLDSAWVWCAIGSAIFAAATALQLARSHRG